MNIQNKKDKLKKKTISNESNQETKRTRARIIVRNLSYKTSEDDIRKYFGQYGTITDMQLLKRPDGKLVGCAFIQYDKVNHAAKAIIKCTNKEFLGREIYVDWAVGKDKYQQTPRDNKLKTLKLSVKTEPIVDKSTNEKEIKIKQELKSESDDESETIEFDEDGDSFDYQEDDKDNIKKEFNEDKKKRHSKEINVNDVKDGCTVFLKNVPFDATNEDIEELCKKFGPIVYALITTDPISGHSKGTAFVKFKIKESADLLLKQSSSNELILMDSILEPYLALSRNEIKQKTDLIKRHTKDGKEDSRNLYLVKEGLIMAGSKAAEGVSASDMAKRHKLEKIKTQILKNLNRFVSRNRLSIHNLPLTYDDEKLRQMIIKHTKLKPHECRVMRENRPSINHPNGKSKGFGFMSFKTHQNALFALRKLNNNPNVFGQNNRPIVAFSIEDRTVHNIKEKRLLKSKQNNPTYLEKLNNVNGKHKIENKKINETVMRTKREEKSLLKSNDNHDADNNGGEIKNYMGVSAKPGEFIRMRSNKKIKEQSKEHAKKAAKLKRLTKRKKEKLIHLKEKKQNNDSMKMIKGKKLNSNKNDKFSVLVEKYKNLIDSKATAEKLNVIKRKKSKWYTD